MGRGLWEGKVRMRWSKLPYSFMGLSGKLGDYRFARYVVLPVPYDGTVSFQSGARNGPLAIINASRQLELFDYKLGKDVHKKGVATLDPLEPDVRGPKYMVDTIYEVGKRIVKDGKFLIGLGGEHIITAGFVRSVKSRYRKFTVLQIDAHLDMRDEYQQSKYSHACVMRRVHELGIGSVSVGTRNVAEEEYRYIKANKIPVFFAEDICSGKVSVEKIVESIGTSKVYISVDMDGFDPAYAPGVGTPEPGGLDWFVVEELLEKVADSKEIIGMDVVETMPLPYQVVTEFLASKVIAKVIGLTSL